MTRKRTSASVIKRRLLSDTDNPDAWEAPIRVGPSRSPRPDFYGQAKHLELAAKFYVLSLLHRLGVEANLTYFQTDNVDIAAVRESGEAFTIDVKTLTGTSRWLVDQFRPRKHHFLVFVCFDPDFHNPLTTPNVYIWSSEHLKAFITRQKATTISLEAVASKLDPTSAWEAFITQPAA
jgi:hypothetical protein